MVIAKSIMCVLIILTGEISMPNLNTYLLTPDQIVIYKDNNSVTYNADTIEFQMIIDELSALLEGSHVMPAFSVSLDSETRQALQEGLWIELVYNTSQTYNQMPFDKLLIQVCPDYSGFNIIRFHHNKYDGRCFYIDLSTNMSALCKKLLNIF